MNTQKQYLLSIIAGLLLVTLGFTYQILDIASELISFLFMNMGIIVIVVAVLKYNKLGAGVTQDEMTRTVSARSLSYSWLLTFVTANILFWIDYLAIFPVTTQHILGILIFGMPISVAVFKKLLLRV